MRPDYQPDRVFSLSFCSITHGGRGWQACYCLVTQRSAAEATFRVIKLVSCLSSSLANSTLPANSASMPRWPRKPSGLPGFRSLKRSFAKTRHEFNKSCTFAFAALLCGFIVSVRLTWYPRIVARDFIGRTACWINPYTYLLLNFFTSAINCCSLLVSSLNSLHTTTNFINTVSQRGHYIFSLIGIIFKKQYVFFATFKKRVVLELHLLLVHFFILQPPLPLQTGIPL